MDFIKILVLLVAALLIALFSGCAIRRWGIYIISILMLFWLQPEIPIRNMDFWLPLLSLSICILVWIITVKKSPEKIRKSLLEVSILVICVLGIGVLRYLDPICCLTASRPPILSQILQYLLILAGLSIIIWSFWARYASAGWVLVWLLVMVFVIIKTPFLALQASAILRAIQGQQIMLASVSDFRWFGYSYIAFRLIHILRDYQTGKLPDLTLLELVNYAIFFPSLAAGPIDRVERFQKDLAQGLPGRMINVAGGLSRILIGLFKKFVIADTLAIFALNSTNYNQISGAGWAWVFLVAYSFRIYLDFSGYTDIAIGIGRILGFTLPENFSSPYLKENLTIFWNNWHITLTQWFRNYYFNPLTRSMRSSKKSIPVPLVVLIGQVSTMVLIGLWHGVTINFLLWGAWHGLGLFIHNRWTAWQKNHAGIPLSIKLQMVRRWASVGATFLFVSLGWVWFALPEFSQSITYFQKLFGMN